MSKKLDETITTIENFRTATKHINGNIQMYVQLSEDDSNLIEVTEVQLVLPKMDFEQPTLILRCR